MTKSAWKDWTNLVLGFWLFLTPWIFSNLSAAANTNAWLVGAAIVISSGLALRALRPWEEWTNLTLGVWMILSPWVLGYTGHEGFMWNSIVIGALVAVLSGYSIPMAQRVQR